MLLKNSALLQTLSRNRETTEPPRRAKPIIKAATTLRGSPARRGAPAANGDIKSAGTQVTELKPKKDVSDNFLLVSILGTWYLKVSNAASNAAFGHFQTVL